MSAKPQASQRKIAPRRLKWGVLGGASIGGFESTEVGVTGLALFELEVSVGLVMGF
jgi:hypothetical protein